MTSKEKFERNIEIKYRTENVGREGVGVGRGRDRSEISTARIFLRGRGSWLTYSLEWYSLEAEGVGT